MQDIQNLFSKLVAVLVAHFIFSTFAVQKYRGSTALNINDDFFSTARTYASLHRTTADFLAYFKHMIRLKCRKKTPVNCRQNRNINH